MRRTVIAALALLLFAFPALAKRRAVLPGAAGHCVTGFLAREAFPFAMAIDAQHVYWLDEEFGALRRAPRLGGAPQVLASIDSWVPFALAVDETNVYIAALPVEAFSSPVPGSILSVPKNGGVLRVLVSGVATPFDVEVDATHVYWVAAGTIDFDDQSVAPDGRIERARKDGTGRETLAGELSAPLDLELEGNVVWFGQTGIAEGDGTVGLYTVAKTGGTLRTVDDDTAVARLALTPSTVIVFGGTETIGNALFAVARDGSFVRTLRVDDAIVSGAQVAGGVAYYIIDAEFKNELWSIPISGGTPSLVQGDLYYSDAFVIDGCAAVVGVLPGDLARVRLPGAPAAAGAP